MNLISVAMFALNVNVDGNSRQARVNGRSDCLGVLCRAVVCCAVSCCGVLCCVVLWCAVLCCGVVWCAVVWWCCGVGGVGGVFRSACFT